MGLVRLLLAISVIVAHTASIAGVKMVGGVPAVQSFYMISGFYMALVLNEKYGVGRASDAVFFLNRCLRLFPVYFVVLALSFLGQAAFPQRVINVWPYPQSPGDAPTSDVQNTVGVWRSYSRLLSPLAKVYLVAANLTTIGQETTSLWTVDESGAVHGQDPSKGGIPGNKFLLVPQAWSVGVEILFYSVAPFIVRRPLKVILAISAACLALRLGLARSGFYHDPWNYRIFPLELPLFLAGAVGYKIFKKFPWKKVEWRAATWVLWSVIVVMIVILQLLPGPKIFWFLCLYAVIAVAIPFLFSLTKNSALDRYLGELSYPVYISHVLVISVMGGFGIFNPWVAVGATLAASSLLYHLVDQPVDRYRQYLASRKVDSQATPAVSGVG
jgi:peptidoglycan/LPS O-acetylase OafA/YrhL